MDTLKPCPKCKTEDRPEIEWDGYDSCLTCKNCRYTTGWNYVYPDSDEVWNKEGKNK